MTAERPPSARSATGLAGRRGFATTVLAGLAGSVLATVAGARDWATAAGTAAQVHVSAAASGTAAAPLAVALGFVSLAAWGVVLVLRGRPRRAVAMVGALAAAGVLASVLGAAGTARHDAVSALVARGGSAAATASLTGWYVLCAVAAAVALGAFAVAVAAAPAWPAMGSRYDAPAGRTPPTGEATEERTAQDLWRALDRGDDPTA